MAKHSCYQVILIWVVIASFWNSGGVHGNSSSSSSSSSQEADKVIGLPGQPNVSFSHYSGYITVNESHGRALFFWFIEAQTNASEKPLILWLNGGPGCSSIGYGAGLELGPFHVQTNGTSLSLNKFSWNRVANMLFLESPIGVGFSYTNTTADIGKLNDEFAAEDAYIFLLKWFDRYPQYKNREFYMAGESYAGHYVPQLAELVYDRSKNYSGINFKGFIVGNPVTDEFFDWNGVVDYAWSHSVIGNEDYQTIKNSCDFSKFDWSNSCNDAVNNMFHIYGLLDVYNLYAPKCLKNTTPPQTFRRNSQRRFQGRFRVLYPANGYDPCFELYANMYFNRPDVQQALHARPTKWVICSDPILNIYNQTVFSVLPIYKKLIRAGLRIWVYSGDIDGRVPVTSTKGCLESLTLPAKQKWQPWFFHQQVAGWIEEFQGLNHVVFKGAGHLVPLNKPREALFMITSFLSNKSLPTRT